MIFTNTTKRILWIDDDVTLLDKQRDLVTKSGWPILSIDCASDALEKFRKKEDVPVRGVLLDTMMDPIPELGPHHSMGILTGVLLAEYLINESFLSTENVIFLTNCKQEIFLDRAERLGVRVRQKSFFHGRKLANLIESEFGE